MKSSTALASLLLAVVSGAASANTATFDGTFGDPQSYTENGITIAAINAGWHVHLDDGLTIMNHGGGCCSSPYLITFAGGNFSLTSFDLSNSTSPSLFTNNLGGSMTIGTDGSFNSFGPGWSNLAWVKWDISGQANMDNLTLTAAVPEPESYALMLAGLGLMGAVARRRKAK